MSKINNIKITYSIVLSLVILAILAIGAIALIPKEARAERAGYVTPYNSTDFNDVVLNNDNYYNAYQTPSEPTVVYYPSRPIVYSSNSSQNQTNSTNSTNVSRTIENSNTNESTESFNSLAASAIFGENSFMPSGLIQWIFFAIIILLIIILARKISGAQNKYHSTELKHE